MASPKQWAAGVALTAVLLGGVGCSSRSHTAQKDESKPVATPTTSSSVAGAQTTGPQGTSSEATAAIQQLVTALEKATTDPGGQPRVPTPEEVREIMQAQTDQLINQAQTKP